MKTPSTKAICGHCGARRSEEEIVRIARHRGVPVCSGCDREGCDACLPTEYAGRCSDCESAREVEWPGQCWGAYAVALEKRRLTQRASALCEKVARLHDPESRVLDDLPALVTDLKEYILELEGRCGVKAE